MAALLRSPNRIIALVLGAAYAAYGVFAFVGVRPVLGAVFAVATVLLLVTARLGIAPARRANIGVGTAWVALGYAGLFLVGTPANVIGLDALVEVALFAGAVVHLAVGLGARRDREPVSS